MYGLNAFALILFAAINVSAVQLCKCSEPTRTRAIRLLCQTLLLFNIGRYALSPLLGNGIKIPVEFSAVAYFVVPTIILRAKKNNQSWAAYSGLMAGFFYYMAMIAAGGPIYNTYPHYDTYISMFCHGTLYLCGFVTIGTRRYSEKDGHRILGGIAYVAASAIVLRPLAEGTQRLFIYELLDGCYVKQMISQNIWHIALPAYYIVLVCLILLSVRGFFRLNRSMYQKFEASREKCAMLVPAI
jgi:hypothetical protein